MPGPTAAACSKTINGGESWREVNRGLIDKTLRTLIIDGRSPKTLYAGTWHGVYKTTDGAESWKANTEGLYDIDVRALVIDPTDSQILYAATDPGGVYRSTDGGWTWTLGEKPLIQHILALAVDPHNPTHVYARYEKGRVRKHGQRAELPRSRTAMVQSHLDPRIRCKDDPGDPLLRRRGRSPENNERRQVVGRNRASKKMTAYLRNLQSLPGPQANAVFRLSL